MQAIPSKPDHQPSFTETARRAQIVRAAIDVIATDGFASASYTKIAKAAGLSSTGLISYHFASKDALIAAILQDVMQQLGDHMHALVEAATSPPAALETYIRGIIGFMRDQPKPMRALLEIVLRGALPYGEPEEEAALSGIARILQWGQETGDFRDFDLRVMATTIQRALDGIPFVQAADPALDLDAWAEELVRTFTLATARAGSGRR